MGLRKRISNLNNRARSNRRSMSVTPNRYNTNSDKFARTKTKDQYDNWTFQRNVKTWKIIDNKGKSFIKKMWS